MKTKLQSCTKFVCRRLDSYRKGKHHILFNRLNAVSSIYILSDTILIFVLRVKDTFAVKWLENRSLLQPFKYISGVSRMIEVHFHIYLHKVIFTSLESKTAHVVSIVKRTSPLCTWSKDLKKGLNNKNALSFS